MVFAYPLGNPISNLPAINRAAFGTANAACEGIYIQALGLIKLLLAFLQQRLNFIEDITVKQRSMGAFGIVHVFLATVLKLPEGNSGISIGLLVVAVTDIAFVGKNVLNFCGCPCFLA